MRSGAKQEVWRLPLLENRFSYRFLRVLLLFVGFLFASDSLLFGSSCSGPKWCGTFARSDVVIIGRVKSHTGAWDLGASYSSYRVSSLTLVVNEVFKGLSADRVSTELDVNIESTDVAQDALRGGAEVLIFGNWTKEAIAARQCYGVTIVDRAQDFIASVRAWAARRKKPWLEGGLYFFSGFHADPRHRPSDSGYVPFQVDLVVQSESQRYSIPVSNQPFLIENMNPGRYRVTAYGDKIRLSVGSREINLVANPCDSLEEGLRYNSEVFGRVLNATGDPVSGVRVEAECINREGVLQGMHESNSGKDGRFRIPGLVPCNYRFRLQPDGPMTKAPYQGAYFPAGANEISAERFVCTGNESKDLGDINLGTPVPLRRVRTKALYDDGRPASQITVNVFGWKRHPSETQTPDHSYWTTDANGVVDLYLLPGTDYRADAFAWKQDRATPGERRFGVSRVIGPRTREITLRLESWE